MWQERIPPFYLFYCLRLSYLSFHSTISYCFPRFHLLYLDVQSSQTFHLTRYSFLSLCSLLLSQKTSDRLLLFKEVLGTLDLILPSSIVCLCSGISPRWSANLEEMGMLNILLALPYNILFYLPQPCGFTIYLFPFTLYIFAYF